MLACYLRLIHAGFRRYSTYRQAVVAGLATNVVFGFLRCTVLLTVFTGSARVAGYDPARLLAEDLGRAGFALLTRFTVPLLVGLAFFDLTLPRSAQRWAAFGLSVLLAVLVSFASRFLLNLVAFWLLDWRGVLSLYSVVTSMLAGLVIPIGFFPGWARTVIWATPFPAIIQAPIDIAVGRGAVLLLLAHQLGWVVVLLAAGRLVLARAVRTLVIQGG